MSGAEDNRLKRLHKGTRVLEEFMIEPCDIFFSYRTDDTPFSREVLLTIRAFLARNGVAAFVARDDIEGTDEWVTSLETALGQCHVLAGFMGRQYFSSVWTQQEIGYALGQGKLTVMLYDSSAEVEPLGFIARYQGLEIDTSQPQQCANSIIDLLLLRHKMQHTWLAKALVRALAVSYDDGHVFATVERLLKLIAMDLDTKQRLARILQTNTLISARYGDLLNRKVMTLPEQLDGNVQ